MVVTVLKDSFILYFVLHGELPINNRKISWLFVYIFCMYDILRFEALDNTLSKCSKIIDRNSVCFFIFCCLNGWQL